MEGTRKMWRGAQEEMTVICLRGWVTSVPPACCPNSAGEKELPWQAQTMETSLVVYLYSTPIMVLPLGPFPVAETQGIRGSWGLGSTACRGAGPESPPGGATGLAEEGPPFGHGV